MTGTDKLELLHNRMISLTQAGRFEWERSLDGYLWSSPNHSLVVEDGTLTIYGSFGQKLFEGAHPLTSDLFAAAASSQEKRAAKLIEALITELDAIGREA